MGDARRLGQGRSVTGGGARRRTTSPSRRWHRRGGFLRTEDRHQRDRRARPQVAVRDHPARLERARALRPHLRRRGQRAPPAGRHPPRHLRQLRALHRHAHRALRRRVPDSGWRRCRRARSWSRRSRKRSRATSPPSCKARGIRADLDLSNDKLGAKIRRAQLEKIPYMLVVGDKEVAAGTVAPRLRDGKQLEPMTRGRAGRSLVRGSQASAIVGRPNVIRGEHH